jgi:hypothetical protein
MKTFLTLFFATLCAASGYGQTIKTLGYNTTNGQVIYTNTNILTFPTTVKFGTSLFIGEGNGYFGGTAEQSRVLVDDFGAVAAKCAPDQEGESNAWTVGYPSSFRKAIGLPLAALTNTNVTNFRTAIGLGSTNLVTFSEVSTTSVLRSPYVESSEFYIFEDGSITFESTGTINFGAAAPSVRTNLGLGGSNIVTFAGLINNGDITINSTTASNGLLYIRRTNNEPFLGLANLLASNNTTVSNETLFRVGVAEATNRSAQFGFRSTNTNGNGVAVFSVFGFDALMMIGADASTNAVIYSGGGTNNEVMTLIRDGATEFARPIRFSTNASTRPETNAPANTTNVAAWVEIRIGTNSYRAPLYQ